MKKIVSLLAFLTFALTVSAQDAVPPLKAQFPRHDVQFSIGDLVVPALYSGGIIFFGLRYEVPSAHRWFGPDEYGGGLVATPSMNFSYRYRVAKWFWVGGTVSYTGFYRTYYDRVTGLKSRSDNAHVFSIMPAVRFSWLNKELVTLYSGVALGYTLCAYEGRADGALMREAVSYCGFQLTCVGVEVGKKWYGFAESGVGVQGFVQAGFGYHFNSRSK